MKINCPPNYLYINRNEQKFEKQSINVSTPSHIKNSSLMSYPSNYYLSFGARVDKGLNRFYDKNKDLMPQTMRKYIDNLSEDEKIGLTPLSAQQCAFEYLYVCNDVDDVKAVYPDEPLFSDLKSCSDVKANRGFLNEIGVISDDIEQEGGSVLSSGEDLTLYIVKKIFVEGKTIKEINEDLDNDIHEVLKREDKNYISGNTCRALGIKLPQREYLTSLRYTRAGYSDSVGDKIKKRWESLSPEEKRQRLDSLLSASKSSPAESKEQRSMLMKERWQKMSDAEKTEYIEKLQTGKKEQSIVMMSAWNKCPLVRKDLSVHLREAHLHNVEKIIYTDKPYSAAMSAIMTEFWAKYPEHAEALGNAIIEANDEVEKIKKTGDYEKYVEETTEKSKKIRAEIKAQAMAETKAKRHSQHPPEAETEPVKIQEPEPESELEIILAGEKEAFPYYPHDYLIEISYPIQKHAINPEYGMEADIKALEPKRNAADYAVLHSLFSCTSDPVTKDILCNFSRDNMIEICKQIQKGNLSPVLGVYEENGEEYWDVPGLEGLKQTDTLNFSKQPDQNAINQKYNKFIKPLKASELKQIKKQLSSVYVPEDKQKEILKPENGYLRGLLGNSFSMKQRILSDIVDYQYTDEQIKLAEIMKPKAISEMSEQLVDYYKKSSII